MQRNIDRLQTYCDSHELQLRPHTKTHKSKRVAGAQMASGACGLTVAKAGEAVVMSEVTPDIFIAYPAVGQRRLSILAELAQRTRLAIGVDSLEAIEQVHDACRRAGSTVDLVVDLEVGFFRTGVLDADHAVALCEAIGQKSHLRFRGLMCFPGHLLPESDAGNWQRYAEAFHTVLVELERRSIPVETVSGGSTPTALHSHRNPFLTEIRPGTYVYNDMNEVRLGVASLDDCAARILATVVSVPSANKFIIDAGSKTLSSDRNCVEPDSGFGHVIEFPGAKISRLSEEHGEITFADPEETDGERPRPPKVGDRVWIVPNHICVSVNLQNTFFLWNENEILELPVDCRGLLV